MTRDDLFLQAATAFDSFEVPLTIGLVALAATAPARRHVASAWRALGRLTAGREWVAPTIAAVISLLAGLPLIALRVPQPKIHDEFSYLLAADTFAHGRLTNPTPAVPDAFEAMQVLVRPTYASKYPPGQGLMLAAGQVLTGRAIAGAWAGAALACAAVAWALRARLPPRWCAVGGALVAIHPRVLYWASCYWGGQIAMLGGALLLGAALRMIRRGGPTVRLSLVGAAGLALLPLSRPSEGAVFAAGVGAWVAYRWLGARPRVGLPTLAWTLLVPAACVLGPAMAWLGYYNWRVTGSPLTPPYVEFIRQYVVAPPYAWMNLRPEPAYHSRQVYDLQAIVEVRYWRLHRHLASYVAIVAAKSYTALHEVFVMGGVTLPFAIAALVATRRRPLVRRAMIATVGFAALIVANQVWAMMHYLAPVGAAMAIVVVEGVRALRAWRPAVAPRIGGVLATALLAFAPMAAASYDLSEMRSYGWNYDRARLAGQLAARGGKHLVVVRYEPGHDVLHEWVANLADLDAQPVLFCRETTPANNAALVAHYGAKDGAAAAGRTVWLLQPDKDFFALTPYSP